MRTIALFLCLVSSSVAGDLVGRCVSVTDGDTVRVLCDGQQVKVRLEGIDAPESRQDFGTRSKDALGDLIHERDVRVEVTGKDRYGRTLGVIWIDDINVNLQLVRDGWAWHFKRYNDDPDLAKSETEARDAKRGLWSHPDPVPPWEWRKIKKPAIK